MNYTWLSRASAYHIARYLEGRADPPISEIVEALANALDRIDTLEKRKEE